MVRSDSWENPEAQRGGQAYELHERWREGLLAPLGPSGPLTIALLQDLNRVSNLQRQAVRDGASETGNHCKKGDAEMKIITAGRERHYPPRNVPEQET